MEATQMLGLAQVQEKGYGVDEKGYGVDEMGVLGGGDWRGKAC